MGNCNNATFRYFFIWFFSSKLCLGEDSGFRIFFPLKLEDAKAKKYITVSAFLVLFVFLLDEPSQGFGLISCL